MKSSQDPARRDFLIEIARMYYEQELSQQQIARKLGISRSSVSHLLRVGKAERIVQIRIEEPSSPARRLQREIKERYHLQEARVVPAAEGGEPAASRVGQAAAALLESILTDGMKIGISWGSTLYQVVHACRPAARRDVVVVQLHGGLGSGNLDIDGFELARQLADRVGGVYRVIRAPIVVQSRELRDMLVREPDIAEALRCGAAVDVALIGIGSNLPEISSFVRAGYLGAGESRDLLAQGAVGTVCGLQIDRQGAIVPNSFNERLIGIEAAALRRIPIRAGVAAGVRKADAVRGALRGGFLTHLFIDEPIAGRLVEEPAEP
jgi:DNA-binding transcriptional regulator LsrR (DeoR family)